MKIKLKGTLDPDLLEVGRKPGDIIHVIPNYNSVAGSMYYITSKNGYPRIFLVNEENYEPVTLEKNTQNG